MCIVNPNVGGVFFRLMFVFQGVQKMSKFFEPLIVKMSLFLIDSGDNFYENMLPWCSRGIRKCFMTNFL